MKPPILSVKADIDEVMWPNRLMLVFIGIWPVPERDGYFARVFARFRLCCIIFTAVSFLTVQSITIYKFWGDIKLIAEISCVMLEIVLMLYKVIYVVIRHDKFKDTYRVISELWSLAGNQEERNAVAEFPSRSKLITIVFFWSLMADVVAFNGGSVILCIRSHIALNGSQYNRYLPLPLWYGIDIEQSPIFELLLASQTVGLAVLATTGVACDTIIMAIIMQFVGQFKLVSLRLKALGRLVDHDISKDKVRRQMGLCIEHHQRVLSTFQSAEKLLNPLTFGQLMLASLEVCMCSFAMIEIESSAAYRLRFIMFLISIFIQLSVFCWPGELIWRESVAIAEAAFYEVPWLAIPCRKQRDLALMMLRAHRPCQISALGMQIMCLRKLSEIFNSALSFMAVLRSMKEQ